MQEYSCISIAAVNRKIFIYLTLLVGVLTYVLYKYHESQPPDQQQIERCNELANQMPQSTEQEINRSIHTFFECLEN